MPVAIDRGRVVAALPAYDLGEQLGAGSFGLVLAGRHRDLDRPVAVKVLSTAPSAGTLAEFKAEARMLAAMNHPHVVGIHDYVEQDELCLLIMELLAGGTVAQRGQSLSAEAACAIGLAAADALSYAHARGVLHRDIKPDNLMFSDDDLLKVTDFGIAKIFDGSAVTASAMAGTPKYMAPEQFETGRLGAATDLYALAVMLYELLAGAPPFPPGLSFGALYRHHVEVVPARPAGVANPVADVVMKSLAKDPTARHPSAHAFALDLAAAAASAFGWNWTTRSGVTLRIADDVRQTANRTAVKPVKVQRAKAAREPRKKAVVDRRLKSDQEQRRISRPVGMQARSIAVPSGRFTPPVGDGELAQRPRRSRSAAHSPAGEDSPVPASEDRRRRYAGWLRRHLDIGVPLTILVAASVALVVVFTWNAGPAMIVTVAGTSTGGVSGNGVRAVDVQLSAPGDVAIDKAGNVYFTDLYDHWVRRVGSDGLVNTVAGKGIAGFSGDGGPAAQARLSAPAGVAVDEAGNVYIADTGNNRVRRVDVNGIITTVAGTGDAGFSGDGGPATQAQLTSPTRIAVDGLDTLYVADTGNARVRRVNPDGTITTVAGPGSPGRVGDGGPATQAAFLRPVAVALDGARNLYIGDCSANRVRRVDADGTITTVAGTEGLFSAGESFAGYAVPDGCLAGLDVDADGNLYLAAPGRARVSRVSEDAEVTTVAGTADAGFSGDSGAADQTQLLAPAGVAVDGAGNVYIADTGNQRIRRVEHG